MTENDIVFYTDGACSFNPGPGGFGVVALTQNQEVVYAYSKKFQQTTNNKMELEAILHVMDRFGDSKIPFLIYSDSAYAVKTYSDWMFFWAKNNWQKKRGDIPENLDIIKKYYNLYQKGNRVTLAHVRGHNRILGNELADKLATGKMTVKEVMEKYGRKK